MKFKKKGGITMENTHLQNSTLFPLGQKLHENFVGDAYLHMVFTDPAPLNSAIGNVTFAPSARNNWHSHSHGQVLLVTGGKGWYQAEGEPARLLHTGDVVNIPPNVRHWHGATKDSWFVHLAMTPGESKWLEPVEDAWYNELEQ